MKKAEELRKIGKDETLKDCQRYAEMLYKRMEIPAQEGEFLITIGSDEDRKLRDNFFRKELVDILKREGFCISESHDRDDVYLTISWREDKSEK